MSRRPSTRVPKQRRDQKAVLRPWRSRVLTIAALIAVVVVMSFMFWAGRRPNPVSPMIEAKKALENGEAANAERALLQAAKVDPGDPEPWLLLLELLRVEDRQIEAQQIGWTAYNAVSASSKRAVLKALTLALLADTPDDLARSTLARWIDADPSDIDARVALLQRIAASPRAQDPDRGARVASLSKIVADHPKHIAAYEALVLALADSGEPDRGREVLESWPIDGRDARYSRMKGRWDLEYDRKYDRAIEEFRVSLKALPHDWRTLYRLARTYRNAGKEAESKKASLDVEKLREAMDPLVLGRRLDKDLAALDDPKSRLDLADLCQRAGLIQLAEAWRKSAEPTSLSIDRSSPR